jgi:hypothetical protein
VISTRGCASICSLAVFVYINHNDKLRFAFHPPRGEGPFPRGAGDQVSIVIIVKLIGRCLHWRGLFLIQQSASHSPFAAARPHLRAEARR